MTPASIPAHYFTVGKEFTRFQARIAAVLKPNSGSGSIIRLVRPLAALDSWQQHFQVTVSRLPRLFQRLSNAVLAKGRSPSNRQVCRALIPLQQSLQELLQLNGTIRRHLFPVRYSRGQQLLLDCLRRILGVLQEIFTFYHHALEQSSKTTMIWQQEIHCRAEMAIFRQWLHSQPKMEQGRWPQLVHNCRAIFQKTGFVAQPSV